MDLLLDTHGWIWALGNPERLGPKAREALSDSGNQLSVSTVSTLEISRLCSMGQLELKGSLASWVPDGLASLRCRTLEMTHEIALAAYALPEPLHPDPADRLLIATALEHELILVTADRRLLRYPYVNTVDARV